MKQFNSNALLYVSFSLRVFFLTSPNAGAMDGKIYQIKKNLHFLFSNPHIAVNAKSHSLSIYQKILSIVGKWEITKRLVILIVSKRIPSLKTLKHIRIEAFEISSRPEPQLHVRHGRGRGELVGPRAFTLSRLHIWLHGGALLVRNGLM